MEVSRLVKRLQVSDANDGPLEEGVENGDGRKWADAELSLQQELPRRAD